VTTHFEHVVRSKLIANKLAGTKPDSIRGLARVMAKNDPVKAETFKRSLFRWMAAGIPDPSPASRALVADALGVDPSELDDDEEAEPVNFGDALQRMFDVAVEKAVDRRLSSLGVKA
jgi:hypothetical protein